MKLKVSIKDNIFKYNGRKIVMKRQIIEYIITRNAIYILEKYAGDGDYDLVYRFSIQCKKISLDWKIKTPGKEFIGNEQRPYVGITITQEISKIQGLTVVDTLGRYLIIDECTGEVVDMYCNRF